MANWSEIRADFPVCREGAYFISAGMSPVPNPVLARIEEEYRRINRYGDIHWERDLELYRALCIRVAGHVGAGAGDMAVVMNTSTAMSIVAMSLARAHSGPFNLISMRDEFPSTTVPFEYQGVVMRYVESRDARYPVDAIMDLVDGETLGVVSSYVQYSTGFRQDLAKLGGALKERGLLFIVNATQGFPLYPIDVRTAGIDVMSASLHKWGFVGHAGAAFVTSPEFRRRYPPPMAGWLSVDTEGEGLIHEAKGEPFKLLESADRYLMGCVNFQAINPLAASWDYLDAIGFDRIRARIAEISDLLIAGLRELGLAIVSPLDSPSERSAIVSFSIQGDAEDACAFLAERGVYVSPRGGNLRAAVNLFNDEGDVARLAGALREYLVRSSP